MRQLIYIRVLNFTGGLLQPVIAELVHGSCYRILDSSADPEHDILEFEREGWWRGVKKKSFPKVSGDLLRLRGAHVTSRISSSLQWGA